MLKALVPCILWPLLMQCGVAPAYVVRADEARRQPGISDPWYRRPPPGLRLKEWKDLPLTAIKPVKSELLGAAEQQLATKPLERLSVAEALRLTGSTESPSDRRSPYLVRALSYHAGRFRASVLGRRLWIMHGSLGHSVVSVKRSALVVYLKEAPSDVYVTCWMAE